MKMLVVALVVALAGCYPPSPIDQGAGSDVGVGGQRINAFGGAPASSQGGPRSSGGGLTEWAAGAYTTGQIVTHTNCPWLFAATSATSVEPCWDLGDGTSASWTRNGVSSSSNGQVILIANVGSRSANMISNSTFSGWAGRELVIDASINGTADALEFGIFNSALSSTQSGSLNGMTGVYGVELDIFNSNISTIENGTAGGQNRSVDSGSIQTTGVIMFDRWYLDFVDLGASVQLTLWRNYNMWRSSDSQRGPDSDNFGPSAKRRVQWATWTISKPSFTTWKFAIGARTGGSAGTFKINNVVSRDIPGAGTWKSIATMPDL